MTDMEKELIQFLWQAYAVTTNNISDIRIKAKELIEKYENVVDDD